MEKVRKEGISFELREVTMSENTKTSGYVENEASIWRWLGAAVVAIILGFSLGSLLGFLTRFIPLFDDGMFLEPFGEFFATIAPFIGFYIAFVIVLRKICHTSLRSFLFGRERRPEIKTALVAGAIFFVSLMVSMIPSFKHFSVYTKDIPLILVNLLFCLMFVWIQTTAEEILFRGFFLRAPYKNEVPVLPRGLLFAFISSLLFMAAHIPNPEVQSQPFGVDLIFGVATYFLSAFCMYISNLLIGGMEAGLVFHFINNFTCFFLIRDKITALPTPAIFINNAEAGTGTMNFISELITFVPPIIYLIWKSKRVKSVSKEPSL